MSPNDFKDLRVSFWDVCTTAMFKYLVKSRQFRKTPVLLKHTLPARKLVSVGGRFQPPLDWRRDFFFAYPNPTTYPNVIANLPRSYDHIVRFYQANKRDQREMLQSVGIHTPESYVDEATHFIVRPLRHFGGQGYRITTDSSDYNPATEYIAPAFPKKREYRVIFVFGTPLILLRKKPSESTGMFDAWNHTSGSFFQTISSLDECRLAQDTSFFSDAQKLCVITDAHLVAADVLANGSKYAVTEINFSPSITLPFNLNRIKEHVSSCQHY